MWQSLNPELLLFIVKSRTNSHTLHALSITWRSPYHESSQLIKNSRTRRYTLRELSIT